jgi:hypothetical protein
MSTSMWWDCRTLAHNDRAGMVIRRQRRVRKPMEHDFGFGTAKPMAGPLLSYWNWLPLRYRAYAPPVRRHRPGRCRNQPPPIMSRGPVADPVPGAQRGRKRTKPRSAAIGSHTRATPSRCANCECDANGKIKRDPAARRDFQRQHPCPATGRTTGACRGCCGPCRVARARWR